MAATDAATGAGAGASRAPCPDAVPCRREAGEFTPGALLAAALALPGVLPATAAAQTVPDNAFVQLNYLGYRDWQPGARRMTVQSPSLYAMMPIDGKWVVEGNVVYDAMSGASPIYFNTLSGASGMGVHDYRTAGDAKVTRHFDGYSIGVTGAYSHERDYISRAGGATVQIWTPDKNRTWTFSAGGAADRIHPDDGSDNYFKRNTLDFLVGVTQSLSPTRIVQSNVTWSAGHGYYSDPYKPADTRPGERQIFAWLTRYNEYFPASDGTLKLAYRWLHDSFGGRSNMVEAAWFQPLPRGFAVQPNVRYYTQGAASFYFDPPFPSGYVDGYPYTADTRLAAYGAFTLGAWLQKTFDDGWTLDLRYQFYRQDSGWRLGGSGSPGILPFSANWVQVGLGKSF